MAGLSCFLVAEDDFQLTWGRTLVHERGTIMGVRKRGWTCVLEELREGRGPTRLRTVVVVPAAQLVCTKGLAPTLTAYDRPVSGR